MSFDIGAVLGDMAGAVKDVVSGDLGKVRGYAKTIMENERASLEELAQARLAGEISEEEFNDEIEREKKVLEAELLTLEIMTKAMTQKAVNSAIDIFVKAVKLAV
jgi:hypothetical protein